MLKAEPFDPALFRRNLLLREICEAAPIPEVHPLSFNVHI